MQHNATKHSSFILLVYYFWLASNLFGFFIWLVEEGPSGQNILCNMWTTKSFKLWCISNQVYSVWKSVFDQMFLSKDLVSFDPSFGHIPTSTVNTCSFLFFSRADTGHGRLWTQDFCQGCHTPEAPSQHVAIQRIPKFLHGFVNRDTKRRNVEKHSCLFVPNPRNSAITRCQKMFTVFFSEEKALNIGSKSIDLMQDIWRYPSALKKTFFEQL